jgi:TonB family protein
VVVLLAIPAVGQATGQQAAAGLTEQEIAARLVGKPLYLRGFWIKDDLRFNAAGQIETPSEQAPFTESGIDVQSVTLTQGLLLIKGQRMALEFLSDDRVQRIDIRSKEYPGKITIAIDGDTSDYSEALHAIFTDDLAGLTPTLPSYWQPYAKAHFAKVAYAREKHEELKKISELDLAAPRPIPSRDDVFIGKAKANAPHGDMIGPRVIKSVDPSFSNVARALKYSGSVEVYLIVEKDGSISHLTVVRPAGLGLDEAAVASVERYRFAPATKAGKPVAVNLYIDVAFQLF